jgi:pteridine reductase
LVNQNSPSSRQTIQENAASLGMMSSNLSGRTVVVTGASRRIGASICRSFAESGADVIIHCNRSLQDAENLANEIGAEVVQGDLVEPETDQQILSAVQKYGNGLFCLVHSASIFVTDEVPSANLMAAVNHEAPRRLTEVLMSELRSARGSVISITDACKKRSAAYSKYDASKDSLRRWTLQFALDNAPEIRANCIAPGAIIPAPEEEEIVDSLAAKIPLSRWGQADDISKAVLFFATSPYITAQELMVDGGWSAAMNQD